MTQCVRQLLTAQLYITCIWKHRMLAGQDFDDPRLLYGVCTSQYSLLAGGPADDKSACMPSSRPFSVTEKRDA